jgi:AmmeMemoRadiSam system protein B
MFYPSDRGALTEALRRSFADARPAPDGATVPKALIVPHAGYVYSGAVAASAYQRLRPARERVSRVVMIGPSHRVPLQGIAVSAADAFSTPLGEIPIDAPGRAVILRLPGVRVDDLAHAREHSLEVQLPFLQSVLDRFDILPLVAGRCSRGVVADVLDAVWGGPETVVVVSTDLSHYLRYAEAVECDTRTAAAVLSGRAESLRDLDACGVVGLRGLLEEAGSRHLSIEELDLRNSGDTAGDRDSVVGYGAFALV